MSPKSGDFGLQNLRRKIMTTVSCPECAADITLEESTEVNEIIVCPDCGVDLEVTSLDPAEVELAPMEEEDWGE
jgi:alpha-aminoadipate/glutamate carrier protein LysW